MYDLGHLVIAAIVIADAVVKTLCIVGAASLCAVAVRFLLSIA